MTRRQRSYSPVSADEKTPVVVKKFSKEKQVFKPVSKDLHENNWASFLIVDATVYKADGRTISNLLTVESEESCVIRGKYIAYSNDRKFLKNPQIDGTNIEIRTAGFAIGTNPIAIWASGEGRWFEIRPSEEYRDMYRHMSQGIEIYFGLEDIYEELRQTRKGKHKAYTPLKIPDVAQKLALIEGTGLDIDSCTERIKSHAAFLFSHFGKDTGKWSSTIFYRWLAAECSDSFNSWRARNGEEPLVISRVAVSRMDAPRDLRSPSPEVMVIRDFSPESPPSSRHSTPQASHGVFVSSTQLSLPAHTAPGKLLRLIYDCVEDPGNHFKKPTFTLPKVAALLNYNYTVRSNQHPALSDHMYARMVVNYWAEPLLNAISLDKEFAHSPLLKDLRTTVAKAPKLSERGRQYDLARAEEIQMMDMKRRKSIKKADGSTAAVTTTTASLPKRMTARHEKRATSTPTHASKSILPPSSGRRATKQAALRPAPTPAKRDSSALLGEEHESTGEVEIEHFGGRRKRRRESPVQIEMGEEDTPTPDIEGASDEEDIVQQTFALSLKSTPIPSTSPTGPNGTWVCTYAHQGCSHVVRDGESEAGKKLIHAHLLEHADGIVKEKLVEQEARLVSRNFDPSHLLEHLRQLGEANRPVTVTVQPIKRALAA